MSREVKIRRKSISFLPLRFLVPFCLPDCLAFLFYINKWEMPILHHSSAMVTHLWARKIAQRSTNAIKSRYFLIHLEKWAVSQFPERAQFCLGHEPSCSLALSWGSKGSGSGTKDDVVFALKLVQYAVHIDGILYHFFGSLSFFS